MSLKTKILAFCLLASLAPLSLICGYAITLASESLTRQVFSQLESVRDMQVVAAQALFDKWSKEVAIYSRVKEAHNALVMLRDAYLGAVKTGEKIDVSKDDYKGLTEFVAPVFEPFLKVLGYEDALLIDDYGKVLYCARQGAEMGEDLAAGALKSSNLARAWSLALKGRTVFVDFESFPGPNNQPAAFVATPIHNNVGQPEGVAVLRLPSADLDALVAVRNGMGETGESLLVGPDKRLRSASPRGAGAGLDTAPARAALEGASGAMIAGNRFGRETLVAYAPLYFGETRWALLAEMDSSEAFHSVRQLKMAAGITVGLTALILAWGTILFLRRQLFAPLEAIRRHLLQVQNGRLNTMVKGGFKAELAELAEGLCRMVVELKNKLGFSSSILKAVTSPCLVADMDGKVAFANQPLLDLLELDTLADSWIGRRPAELFYGLESGQSADAFGCFEKGRKACGLDIAWRGRKGAAFHVRLDSAPLYDLDGQEIGVFHLFTDLTQIKRGELEIRGQRDLIAKTASEADLISLHVSQSSEDLAAQVAMANEGAASQTARIQETGEAIDEINRRLLDASKRAKAAAGGAAEAMRTAQQGASLARESVAAIATVRDASQELRTRMRELGEQATAIDNVVSAISEIADQTNLLALNAAIEAARAGDAGRGFAVVADEVRKLAEKTMIATRDAAQSVQRVQGMVMANVQGAEKTVSIIEAASGLVNRSGEALQAIAAQTSDTAGGVRVVAADVEEQAQAQSRVIAAVEEVRRIAQDTATGMSSSAQSIVSLVEQAGELKRLIRTMNEGA
jgi:methyl-accepting chemotaxis protein